jgi:uncharacterized protein (TIGR03437 family)
VNAQPVISPRGIVSPASYTPAGLPSGPIARGAFFAIFGPRLGTSTSGSLSYPLSNTLSGVQVLVTQGSTTVNAIPYFVNSTLVNAIMPSNAPLGQVAIYVVNGNSKSPPSPAVVVNANFSAFTQYGYGFGPGLIQNFSNGVFSLNTTSSPAKPGQAIVLYGTGLGPVTYADNIAPSAGTLPTQVEIFIGGESVPAQYSGRNVCCSAFDQINFQLPSDVALGCWVPLQVRTSGAFVSNVVTMSISSDGSPCSDPLNPLSKALTAQNKFGLIALMRVAMNEDVGLAAPGNITTDTAMMTFQQENFNGLPAFHPIFSLPPAGTCTMYATSGDLLAGHAFPAGGTTGQFFNAGASINLAPAAGNAFTVKRPTSNARGFQPLGSTMTLPGASGATYTTLFLNPGNFTASGSGGSDVGAFQAAFVMPAPLSWTNRDRISPVNRSQPLTLNWSNAPSGQPVVIFGGAVDLPSNGSAVFACVASPGATSFTIPANILQALPPTRANLVRSKGAIYVGSFSSQSPTTFSATGLDTGLVLPGSFVGKTVIFQ